MNVAVVDIGSNSTRLLIAERSDHRVTELVRRSEVTRLGAGVDADGRLRDDAMQRVFDTLDGYRAEIDAHHCESAVAVLTSAVRDSANGGEFAEQVRTRYGLAPHVLSGDDEAQLTFRGATSERDAADRTPTLVLDIGGGSTEVVIGAGAEVLFHVSTQAGVVRQTERHLHDDPPPRPSSTSWPPTCGRSCARACRSPAGTAFSAGSRWRGPPPRWERSRRRWIPMTRRASTAIGSARWKRTGSSPSWRR